MKKIISAFVLAVLATSQAQAISISRGGGSASKSMGMSRPAITQQAAPRPIAPATAYRPAQPAAIAPAYRPAPPPAAPAYAPHAAPVASSPGLGSTFLAGAGGGLVGSMLGNAINGGHGGGGGTTVVNNGAPAAGAAVAAPSADVAPSTVGAPAAYPYPAASTPAASGKSVWGWLGDTIGFFLLVALVILGCWLTYRLIQTIRKAIDDQKAEKANNAMLDDALPFSPAAKFWAIQRAFAANDTDALKWLTGPDVLDEALAGVLQEPQEAKFSGVHFELIDRSATVISIHYRAHDDVDNVEINEVWHFVLQGGRWLLNGIEQIQA